jgi:hypothetical protein
VFGGGDPAVSWTVIRTSRPLVAWILSLVGKRIFFCWDVEHLHSPGAEATQTGDAYSVALAVLKTVRQECCDTGNGLGLFEI